MLRSL